MLLVGKKKKEKRYIIYISEIVTRLVRFFQLSILTIVNPPPLEVTTSKIRSSHLELAALGNGRGCQISSFLPYVINFVRIICLCALPFFIYALSHDDAFSCSIYVFSCSIYIISCSMSIFAEYCSHKYVRMTHIIIFACDFASKT